MVLQGFFFFFFFFFLSKKIDPNFVNYCEANSMQLRLVQKQNKLLKVTTLKVFIFILKMRSILMLAKIALGGRDSKIAPNTLVKQI